MGYTDVILSQPPKGGWINLREKVGHRLVFLGTHDIEEQPDPLNQGKTRLVATVDYVDLDDGAGGVVQWGALVDKPGVVNKLKNQRTAIMGRLILGEAKTGQSAPFILADHEPGDAQYFMQTWMPANRAALAGRQQAPSPAPVATPAPAGPQPQYQQPLPVAAQAPAAQAPLFNPAAAPVAANLADGQTEAYSPEAVAAIQRMMASGQLPGFPQPTH